MLLGYFARLPKNARVLDLGSGCGTLGVLLCAKDAGCHVTGVELTEVAHAAALENICRNGLQARMESICADLRSIALPTGSFQISALFYRRSCQQRKSSGPAGRSLFPGRTFFCGSEGAEIWR